MDGGMHLPLPPSPPQLANVSALVTGERARNEPNADMADVAALGGSLPPRWPATRTSERSGTHW